MSDDKRLIIDNWKDQKSIYDDVKAPLMGKRAGAITIDGIVVCETLQCCHCQKHFPLRRGSGEIRGFCMNCMQTTCGKPLCVECVPWRKKMEMVEQAEKRRLAAKSYLTED